MSLLDKITLEIEFEGPFYFGMGKESTAGTDLSVYQRNDSIIIPGSAIKGVIRAAVEKFCKGLHAKIGGQGLEAVESCSPFPEEGHENFISTCKICQIFGWRNLEGKLRFKDKEIKLKGESRRALHKRNMIQLDRVLSSSAEKMLMNFEFVHSSFLQNNAIIPIEIIILKPLSDLDITILYYGLKLVNRLGGLSSRGMGKVKKIELKMARDVNHENVLKEFLEELNASS
ncbi:MAG: RAMP superfamily CRISPR-associated protein [Candidatus Helarchaeota archaeon]